MVCTAAEVELLPIDITVTRSEKQLPQGIDEQLRIHVSQLVVALFFRTKSLLLQICGF
jgi:hypothetical protein